MRIKEIKYFLYAFFFPFFISLIVFGAIAVHDGGVMNYYGDFNSQQLTFGELCVKAVQGGDFGWNWYTDLGVNFLGSYSFYTLGSPFFWLTALFPSWLAPYLVAPMLALKTGLASAFAFIYIRRFVENADTAVLGGVIYALSGYAMLNVVFNHFHDVICFFPLLLVALEEAVNQKRKGFFALAVALSALVNYYFFIGEVVFLVIYFVIRMWMDKSFRITKIDFFSLAFESIVGVMLAGILFVPSIYQVLDVPRATSFISDNGIFVHPSERYGFFFESLFFMPEYAYTSYVFPDAETNWSSVSLYIPLLSMAGVFAFIKGNKKHWASVLTLVCGVILLIPAFNSVFVLFNAQFYGRWLYMPILVMCMMTVRALESDEYDIGWGNKVCGIIVVASSLLYLLHPIDRAVDPDIQKLVPIILTGFVELHTYVTIAVAIISVIVVAIVIKVYMKQGRAKLVTQMTSAVVLCCFAVNIYYHSALRLDSVYPGYITENVSAEVEIEDDDFYRIEPFGYHNLAMMLGYPSADCFHSIVPASVYSIYELLGIERGNISGTPTDMYAFMSYTSAKYAVGKIRAYSKPESLGYVIYEEYAKSDGYTILKNDYALPMGFTYDEYAPLSAARAKLTGLEEAEVSTNDKLMISAVILDEQQAEKYADMLTPISEDLISDETLTLERFKEDAKARIAAGVDEFVIDENQNFSVKTSYESDELVVFSVPFDKGWSCTINGNEAEIDSVNGGFIAVRVPAGESDIRFIYTTPGRTLGAVLTAAGAAMIAAWFLLWHILRKKDKSEQRCEEKSATIRTDIQNKG